MKVISNKNVENKKRFSQFYDGDTFIFGKNYYMKIIFDDVPPFQCDNCDSYIDIQGSFAVNLETGVVRNFKYSDMFEPCTCSATIE